jgi:hypothetical protein
MGMKPPASISKLEYGELTDGPGTAAYIKYDANTTYLIDLVSFSSTSSSSSGSPTSQGFRSYDCTSDKFHAFFSKWVPGDPTDKDKQCVFGVVKGNASFLVYNTKSMKVDHVIDLVKD